jgi:hypothetical protein
MLLMLAACVAWRARSVLGDRAPFVTYYPLTVFLALYAGSWPAAACGLSVILSGLLFGAADPIRTDVVALAIYLPVNAVLIVLIERVRRAGEAARRRERAAREREAAAAEQRAVLEAALESVDAGVHSWDPETGVAHWDARLRTPIRLQPRRAGDVLRPWPAFTRPTELASNAPWPTRRCPTVRAVTP